ncbi:MAG: hypothetical protein Sapg2KO_19970 [Saprospiraceae bacterium]
MYPPTLSLRKYNLAFPKMLTVKAKVPANLFAETTCETIQIEKFGLMANEFAGTCTLFDFG